MRRTTRRWGLHSMVYAADPWAVMLSAVQNRCTTAERTTAASFVRQAREYFTAAEQAGAIETKPVLYYYSFLNLAKAAGLADRQPNLVGSVYHGLQHSFSSGERLTTATLTAHANVGSSRTNVFDVLHLVLTGAGLPRTTTIPVAQLLAQSVVGHRLWCEATAGHRRERFLSVASVRLLEDPAAGEIWSRIEIPSENLRRSGRSLSTVAMESGLSPHWRHVTDGTGPDGRAVRRFEQIAPLGYGHRAADEVVNLIAHLKPHLHRTILSSPPYRRYYLYLKPATEERLPQLLVVHALMFFFGSLTRYRPEYLLRVLDGEYGGFIREFLATQPLQYVYSLASELAQREVTRAEVV